ncbi:class I adenylate-forming enzyme family protein [Flavivirga jejuensis]|uniref:Class I adenylate-forming enzyme family protein n=1 Tax=Flavivirga jejuensis TaxID=870487 RepID=A0ABT8WTP3_9FLAO|nr:class I adenylate-forming enzyme family protein [Flavivirga jejuensis]MDO5976359.1 class I adenylate-forming enzyme family protein [Flavivirga jejuensis]
MCLKEIHNKETFFNIDLDKIALCDISEGIQITYGMLINGVIKLKEIIDKNCISSGSVITISCKERLHQALYLICGLNLPYTINPLDPDYSEEELNKILLHSETKLIISDKLSIKEGRDIVIIEPDVSNICKTSQKIPDLNLDIRGKLLIYTSGTTGNPKGVLLSSTNIIKNTNEAIYLFGYNSSWITASVLPMFHTFTLISDIIPVIRMGGKCVICKAFNAITSRNLKTALKQEKIKSFSAVPIIFQAINALFEPEDTNSLKFTISGAAPLSEKVRLDFFSKFNRHIIPCYGLSETTCFATITPFQFIKPRTVGKPAGISIRVVDTNENEMDLPLGEIGEIIMKGDSVIQSGYYNDTMQKECYTVSGYFRTGDLGYFDSEGYLYIAGRRKNMVIRGGKKVYLEDVDQCIEELNWVKESVSVAILQADKLDSAITFVIVQNFKANIKEEIIHHIDSKLNSIHIPDQINIVDEIPRTKTGKPKIENLKNLILSYDN